MLDKDKYLAIKKLAQNIRNDNEKLFKTLAKEEVAEAVKNKDEFINETIKKMDIHFSEGDEGKEENQMLRANILIPDDKEFFTSYSNDKNIRNLMNKYAVSIEDIMSKITELNLYGNYASETKEEPKEELDFVSEMTKLSPKQAETLLDEIENLSDVVEEVIPEKEEVKAESFEDMTDAISGFLNEYDETKKEYKSQKDQVKKLEADLAKLKEENKELEKSLTLIKNENKKSDEKQIKLTTDLEKAKEENKSLKEENKDLQAKLEKSSQLLRKIYDSIKK